MVKTLFIDLDFDLWLLGCWRNVFPGTDR